jgi:DNA-binding transcriptional ArsR family regulator
VMMHLRVLEEAGLVVPVRKGRERFNHLDAMPIQALHARWIGPHAERAAEGLLQLKSALEDKAEITTGE